MNPARHSTAVAVVLSVAGSLLAGATGSASAATSCASPVYKRQFFANTALSGTAKKTDCDNAIDQTWTGAPASGLPKDNFGVRWSVTRDFGSGGPFALAASGLDGIRVYVDGARKVDLWKNTSKTVSKTANVTIPKGKHTLRIDYANWTGAAKVKFTYTPRTSATVDKVDPLTPTGAAVSASSTTGKAKLTWSKNKEMDLAGYRVYRRLKGTSFGTKPLATTTSTTYTDTPPATGDTYYYEVRAYDRAGNESTGTADKPVTTVDAAPARVTGVVGGHSGFTGVTTLTWHPSPETDVKGYQVYRDVDGTWTLVSGTSPLTTASYTSAYLAAGDTRDYYVVAVDKAGHTSARSATVTPLVVQAPIGLAGSGSYSGVSLSWASTGAAGTTYNVYRVSIEYYGSVSWPWEKIGSTTETSFADLTGTAGLTYIYAVTASDTHGNESDNDDYTFATRTKPTTPVEG
ncbi:fibronectin type III domain-containing protein [Streptomyces sp. Agncl-13]|uniref:fibronectin type III domain-containing protein n=1 Tax=Streptomyces sp. Agncl-13 TaxID=3400628 RepID=UPI003A84462E